MPVLLNDITVYYFGDKIYDCPENWEFRKEVNYISDFYHKMLFGYKPPKTARICIHLHNHRAWGKPDYNGSICRVLNIIDDEKYLSLSKDDRYKYILELIHTACLECVGEFGWDKAIFVKAYDEVNKCNFNFHLDYCKLHQKLANLN